MNIFKSVLLCGLLALSMSSHAVVIKIATVAPDGTSWMKEMRKAANRVEEKTSGRIKLKFYPGGVMGADKTVLRKIKVGQIHGGAFTGGELASLYPSSQLYSAPFLFRNEEEVEHVRAVMDEKIKAGLDSKGLHVLAISGGGFAYLMSDREVITLDQLSQKKVWLPKDDKLMELVFKELNLNPVTMSLADVYTGLQTGLVDTVATTSVGAIAFQWHTRLASIIAEPVSYVIGMLVVDKKIIARLDSADVDILSTELRNAFATIEEITRKDNKAAFDALQERGLKMVGIEKNELSMIRSRAGEAMEKAYQQGLFDKDLYNRVTTLLEKKRKP